MVTAYLKPKAAPPGSSPAARATRREAVLVRHAVACLVLTASGLASAQIYRSAPQADAGLVLSNFPSVETPELLVDGPHAGDTKFVAASPPAAPSGHGRLVSALRLPVIPAELKRQIADVASKVQIAPELLHAVIATESAFDPRAVSPRGAIGLMQLMPATAARFGARDPLDVGQNLLAGASYLKWLMAEFSDDLELVLAAYNAGEGAVRKAGRRIPPFAETQAYVPRVLAYLRCASDLDCKPT